MDLITELIQFFTDHWFTFAIASIIALLLFRFGTKRSRQLKPYSHLPGPKPWPFLGNLPDAMKARGQDYLLFDKYYKKYGKLFVMGGSSNVIFFVSAGIPK